MMPGESQEMPTSPRTSSVSFFKNIMLPAFAGVSIMKASSVFAEDEAPVVAKVELGPPPEDFGLTENYYTDCAKVLYA